MKLVGVLALAGGVVAAPLIAAAAASAVPPPASCDGADCVPGVPRNAAEGGSCVQGTRYAFGLNAAGTKTFICSSRSQWVPAKPLIGVRPLGSACSNPDEGYAQSPDGIPLSCTGTNWVGNYNEIFYSKTY